MNGLPPEFARLHRLERLSAMRNFDRWTRHYETMRGSALSADDRSRSLNLSYIGVAAMWLLLSLPFWAAAGVFWSYRESVWQVTVACVLTAIVVLLMMPMALRWRQAREFWPGKVDPRV